LEHACPVRDCADCASWVVPGVFPKERGFVINIRYRHRGQRSICSLKKHRVNGEVWISIQRIERVKKAYALANESTAPAYIFVAISNGLHPAFISKELIQNFNHFSGGKTPHHPRCVEGACILQMEAEVINTPLDSLFRQTRRFRPNPRQLRRGLQGCSRDLYYYDNPCGSGNRWSWDETVFLGLNI